MIAVSKSPPFVATFTAVSVTKLAIVEPIVSVNVSATTLPAASNTGAATVETTILANTFPGSAPLSTASAPLITGIAHELPVANAATFTAVFRSGFSNISSPKGRIMSAAVSATLRTTSPTASPTSCIAFTIMRLPLVKVLHQILKT